MPSYRILKRSLALFMATLFLLTSLGVPAAQAAMINTADFAHSAQVDLQRQDIVNLLGRDGVRDQLVSWGVDVADAQQRVDAMTPAEVAALHERMDALPAGAGAGGVVGAVVFVFLVLLVTDILGLTSVFPFTHSQR